MENDDVLKETFKVLADINRIRIIEALTKECESVNEIVKQTGISQSLDSHHLKVWKEASFNSLKLQHKIKTTIKYRCFLH